MAKLGDICDFLENKAPSAYKMDFDNVGLLIGGRDRSIERILIALEITEQVIGESAEMDADLIVTHHPVFFSLKSVTSETPQGLCVMKLLEHKIAAICMHTNLDAASGGVNDALAEIAGLSVIGPLANGGTDQSGRIFGIGRTGKLSSEMPMQEYLAFLKKALRTNGLRYYDSGRPVYHVAVGGGSCGEYLEQAIKLGCDTFVTVPISNTIHSWKRGIIILI
jgi:dinuclear metal center YbgI/SA1388 family protein